MQTLIRHVHHQMRQKLTTHLSVPISLAVVPVFVDWKDEKRGFLTPDRLIHEYKYGLPVPYSTVPVGTGTS